ncbi:MAG TPA: ATP-binding protein [Polyangia bacterium]
MLKAHAQLAAGAPHAVVAIDRDLGVCAANPAWERLWGVRARALHARPLREALGAAALPGWLATALDRAFAGASAATRCRAADARLGGRLFDLAVRPLHDRAGAVAYVTLSLTAAPEPTAADAAGAALLGGPVAVPDRAQLELFPCEWAAPPSTLREELASFAPAPVGGATGFALPRPSAPADDDAREAAIAALRRQVDELAEEGRHRDEFLAMAAHELRNPLAALTAASQLLARVDLQDPLADRVRGTIARQTAQMTHLVNDLLDCARLANGRLTLERQPVDLVAVVQQTVEATRPLVAAHGDRLSVSVPAAPVVVDGDPARLQQVLSNLLVNAAKYTPRGGRIGLALRREKDEAVVRVTDSGVGIPPELLARIFQPFTQGEGVRPRAEGGLGLGLAVVRVIVSLHGGAVSALSGGPGRGSEFVVRFPALPAAPLPAVRVVCGPRPARPPGRPARVLVVEDDPHLAEAMASALGLWGHRVELCANGPAALASARRDPPEIVILDLGLPDSDPVELARRLRAQLPDTASARLIGLSDRGRTVEHPRLRAGGFDRYLDKPIDVELLRDLVEG